LSLEINQLGALGAKPADADVFAIDDITVPITTKKVRFDELGFLELSGGTMTGTLDMGAQDIDNVKDLTMDNNAIHLFNIDRNAALADDATIGEIQWRSKDGGAVLADYANIRGVMESDAAGSEDGSLHFYVARAGTHNDPFMTMNDASDGEINILRDLQMISSSIKLPNAKRINWAGSANRRIFNDGSGFIFEVETGDNFSWEIEDVSEMTLDAVELDLKGNDIIGGGTIKLIEQADANADLAGSGQIWVNTAAPNELFFTDDAGTDIQITPAKHMAFVSHNDDDPSNNTEFYIVMGGIGSGASTQLPRQSPVARATTFSKLGIEINSNGLLANGTLVFMNDGSAGNQSVTITAGVAAYFEDTSNTDAVAAQGLVAKRLATVGSEDLDITGSVVIYD